ncbi:hypothetical protein MTYP_00171 [Methylophilaceae bacterium]|nr:hypothetical protein MTYP_00171 [Methylophilaceae bacterium]
MARTYTAFINRADIPLRKKLQAAIKALGFKLTLEDDYVPFASSGYLPCTLDGEDAGLTLRFDASNAINGKDSAITLQWSGDPREEASVVMIAAALAQDSGAVVRGPDGSEKNADELTAAAEKVFAGLV